MSEPKMVMMETFRMAISHTDSKYSSLCWAYILLSSLGDVTSCLGRRRGGGGVRLGSYVEVTHCGVGVYINLQVEDGLYFPSLPV